MVQDLFDPEFFLSQYEVHDINDPTKRRLCSSLYRDVINCEVRGDDLFTAYTGNGGPNI